MLKKYAKVIKFLCSSLASFVIDYVLRIVLGILFVRLMSESAAGVWANVIARLISATFNFLVNKNVVFKGDESTFKAAVKYACLAFFVMLVDTVVNEWLLIGKLGLKVIIAKPITEVIMFFINYPIQKLFVYRKRQKA